MLQCSLIYILSLVVASIVAAVSFAPILSAQTPEPVAQQQEEKPSNMKEAAALPPPVTTQSQFRGSKTVSLIGNYGLYSFLVPGKKGAQLNWIQDASSIWEFDYFSGDYGLNKYGINLLSFGERVMVLRYRKFWSSTFNLGLGLGERRYSFELGSRLLENIPGDIAQREKLVEMTRHVFDLTLGNRWHFNKGLVINVDWLDLAIPFGPAKTKAAIVDRIEDEEDRKNTKKVLKYLNYLPTVSLIKLGIGFAL